MNRHLLSLYLYYGIYFTGLGLSTYASRYFGVIGLSNAQIGLISAIPAFIALFAQPLWGAIADRSRYKRSVIVLGVLAAAFCAFAADLLSAHYVPLLIALTLLSVFTLHAVSVASAISIEYTESISKAYGPIRLTGTIGYQAGILLIGFLLNERLTGLYALYGVMLLLSAVAAAMMPPVPGHQHGAKRIPITRLFEDKRILVMLTLAFLVQTMAQFYASFFSKYLGEIGMSTAVAGVITVLSVIFEIPFLIVGDKLYKKLTIFQWMWLGLLLNALRFVGISLTRSPVVMAIILLPTVFLMICFEFCPAIFLTTAVSKELTGTALSVYQSIGYGVARIIGAMLGGVLADRIGIDGVFFWGGGALLLVCLFTFVPLWRRAGRDIA